MRMAVCLVAALGCGTQSRPDDVRAWQHGDVVEVSWKAAGFLPAREVQLADLESGRAVSEPVTARGTHVSIPGVASGVWMDPPRRTAVVSAGPEGGTGARWQIFAPWDFRDGVLSARFAQVSPGERLAVLLVNFDGADGARADVAVDGTGPAMTDAAPAALTAAPRERMTAGHELLRARESLLARETPAAAETVQAGAHRSFCVVPGLDFSHHLRKPATLGLSTAHADLYVDDEDLGEYEGPALQPMADALEARVWPAVTARFGTPQDVDGNGKLLVLITHELGAHLKGGWLIGYFGNADLIRSRDDSTDCGDGGSNHAEIVYLNDLRNGESNGYAAAELLSTVYPATVAHELQHLLNFERRCVSRSCDGPEAVWINEALSKVAEDLAGYGWNSAGGRAEGAAFLRRADGALRGYDGRSLTRWEGDPIGNYQGVHSFLRLFVDRLGADLATRIAAGPGGIDGLEAALGLPLPLAIAQWATALLLSNEPGSPWSFSGTEWSPLHDRLRHLDTRPPGPLALRRDGISAVLSGAGTGGAARVTVRSSEDIPPFVVVVRASASLPDR